MELIDTVLTLVVLGFVAIFLWLALTGEPY
jgi:hypothetical protein